MASIEISWDLPTTREDGSALPLTSIKQTIVEVKAPGSTVYTALAVVPGNTVKTLDNNVVPGAYSFRLTVEDTGGRKSTQVLVAVTVPAATISPPKPVVNAKAVVI